MRWLVVESHDERYDFNLTLSIFNGSLEDFEDKCSFFSSEDRQEYKDGVLIYNKEFRTDKRYPNGIDCETWDNISDYLELVDFHTIILIPFDNLTDDNFYLVNGLVSRNVKFGFLDLKDKTN